MIVVVQTVAGLLMLFFGGEWLVRGASALAARLGVSPLAIGLTVVAFGTSAPELVVSLQAALAGANDISVGNVVGSNIANVGLILGLAALIRPAVVHTKIVRIDAPIMIAVSFVLPVMLVDGGASPLEGGALVLGLAAYAGFTFWEARRETAAVQEELADPAGERLPGARSAGLLVLAGLGLLVLGGHLLVTSAVEIAASLGVRQATIGLTIVAVGTSLPELATSVIASLRGQGDIAIGNVIGSNVFNILGILGVTTLVRPLEIGGITWIDLGTMIGLACVLTLMVATRRRLARGEGALLLASYVGYTVWLVAA